MERDKNLGTLEHNFGRDKSDDLSGTIIRATQRVEERRHLKRNNQSINGARRETQSISESETGIRQSINGARRETQSISELETGIQNIIRTSQGEKRNMKTLPQKSIQKNHQVCTEKSEWADCEAKDRLLGLGTMDMSYQNVIEQCQETGASTLGYTSSAKAIFALVERLEDIYEFRVYNNDLYVAMHAWNNPNLLFYDLIKADQSSNDLRKLIPRDCRKYIRSNSDVKEVFHWLLIDAEVFDREPSYDVIMFQNTAYNWRKREEVSNTTQLFIRGQLQVDYKGGYQTGAFTDFIKSVFDAETVPVFYRFLGLCLSDVRFLKYIFYICGDTNSGKTVITDLISRIIGQKYVSSVSFSDFSNDFYISSMLNSKINIGAESSGNGRKRAETLLSVSGKEYITTAGKYQDPYQQKSDSLLIFTTNSLPQISLQGQMVPLLERSIIFPIYKMKKREKWDPELLQRLLEDSDTVVDVAMRGLCELADNNWVIKKSVAMEEAIRNYRKENDSFVAFIEDTYMISRNNKDSVSSNEIDSQYEAYCAQNKIQYPLPQNQRSQIMSSIFGLKKEYASRGVRGYKGLKPLNNELNEEFDSNDMDSEENYWDRYIGEEEN